MPQFLETISAIQNQHQLRADYEKTLALLAALKSGALGLENFKLSPGGWQFVPDPVDSGRPQAVIVTDEADDGEAAAA